MASDTDALQRSLHGAPAADPELAAVGATDHLLRHVCVEHRKPVLANDRAWQLCLTTLHRLDRWTLLAALAMPDHLHLLIAPSDREASVSDFTKWFKRWFNEALPDRGWKWQQGSFDRLLRSDESLSDKWAYIRENPVRAGLVNHAGKWRYQYAFNAEDSKL